MNDSPEGLRTQVYTDVQSGVLKERHYQLRITGGPDKGQELQLSEGTLLVGTHANNDLVLSDDSVSRYHLEVQVRRSGLRIKDQATTNGTFHGEAKIDSLEISTTTRLRLGKHTTIEFLPVEDAVELGGYDKADFGGVIGASQAMRRLFALLDRVASTDATLLLEGETGTGKEAISEAVHKKSSRAQGPFIVVDCGAIPENLIGSELFGHVKGAYTGAQNDKQGLIQAANGGTLFLDEIGELAIDMQPQLLRVLEKREIRRIGDTQPQAVDIRVIAATNRNLKDMVKAGTFREDLYYRLAVVKAVLPPLRKRLEDVPLLAMRFADELTTSFSLSPTLVEVLKEHPWRGNVRELRNVVERALSLRDSDGHVDPAQILGPDSSPPQMTPAKPLAGTEAASAPELLELPFKEAKGQLVEAFERDYLTQLLARHKGNISQAAHEAGIDRNYIHRLVKRYKIIVERS